MGKKGKGKKEKITGTPEVIKFKGTKEFQLLKGCSEISKAIPYVAASAMDQDAYKQIARYLNMLGLLAEFLKSDESKEYRFQYHHSLVAPSPQYFPLGYPATMITIARNISSSTQVRYNDKDYDYASFAPELQGKCNDFLKDLDEELPNIGIAIDEQLKEDFPTGLRKFNVDMGKRFNEFDKKWVAFESAYLEAKAQVDSDILQHAQKMVDTEKKLTRSEEMMEIAEKQKFENEFIGEVEDIIQANWKYIIGIEENRKKRFHHDVLPLAEACIFYESKCTPEWLQQAKQVIKDYLELRVYVSSLPETRLQLEFDKNTTFIRLLRKLHTSILAAEEALAFVDQLPMLLYNKKEKWMTRSLLEPDLQSLKKIAT